MSNISNRTDVQSASTGQLPAVQELPATLVDTTSKAGALSPVQTGNSSGIQSTTTKRTILQGLQDKGTKTLDVLKTLTGIKKAQQYFANKPAKSERAFTDASSAKGRQEIVPLLEKEFKHCKETKNIALIDQKIKQCDNLIEASQGDVMQKSEFQQLRDQFIALKEELQPKPADTSPAEPAINPAIDPDTAAKMKELDDIVAANEAALKDDESDPSVAVFDQQISSDSFKSPEDISFFDENAEKLAAAKNEIESTAEKHAEQQPEVAAQDDAYKEDLQELDQHLAALDEATSGLDGLLESHSVEDITSSLQIDKPDQNQSAALAADDELGFMEIPPDLNARARFEALVNGENKTKAAAPIQQTPSISSKVSGGKAPKDAASSIAQKRANIQYNLDVGRGIIEKGPYAEKEAKAKAHDDAMRQSVESLVEGGARLKLMGGGLGGARLLSDSSNISLQGDGAPVPRYIIKANDEDTLQLNNPKKMATLGSQNDATRSSIVPGQEPQRSTLAYDLARTLGMEHITPATTMVVLTSSDFHDILDGTEEASNPEFVSVAGEPVRTKLCSAQKFVADSKSLEDCIAPIKQRIRNENGTEISERIRGENPDKSEAELTELIDDEINETAEKEFEATAENIIDLQSYQETFLFSLLLGEADGNLDNIRLRPNPDNPDGPQLMFKVDNGQTFPTQNSDEITTWLVFFDDLLEKPLSEKSKEHIRSIPTEVIIEKIAGYKLSKAEADAFKFRVLALKFALELSEVEGREVTSEDLSTAIGFFAASGGRKVGITEEFIFQRLTKYFKVSPEEAQVIAEKLNISFTPPVSVGSSKTQEKKQVETGPDSSVVHGIEEGPDSSVVHGIEEGPDSSVVHGIEEGPESSYVIDPDYKDNDESSDSSDPSGIDTGSNASYIIDPDYKDDDENSEASVK